jgi:hypothetical protein
MEIVRLWIDESVEHPSPHKFWNLRQEVDATVDFLSYGQVSIKIPRLCAPTEFLSSTENKVPRHATPQEITVGTELQ